MNILLCGAQGFIGRHLRQVLEADGHRVLAGVRKPMHEGEIAIDYLRDTEVDVWLPRLLGIDCVVNAVGVLRDTSRTPMALLHDRTPCVLFKACARQGVRKVIQISALGVDGKLETAYMRSKGKADACLRTLDLDWTILRPSLVYGDDGASARMFKLLARLPVVGLPGRGDMPVQPVHIDDVAAAVRASLSATQAYRAIVDCVGPRTLSYRAMLESYARQLGARTPCFVPIPWTLMRIGAALCRYAPASPLEPETLAMLRAGSQADPAPFSALLGRAPRDIDTFIERHHG